MTALFVVGSAPCLYDDIEKARELFPDAETMLVNGACVAIENAEHVLAGHASKAEEFAAARRATFPNAKPWRLHASRLLNRKPYPDYPSVTDWHEAEMSSGATSAGKAALIGLKLGYAPIVLCGCPMDGSGYFPGESEKGASIKHEKACQRIGDAKMQDRRTIVRYREKMRSLALTTFQGKVFSMSGFTREVLGFPGG